jgi:hypothetical protein
MPLNPKSFGLACGVLWGPIVFLMTLAAAYVGVWTGTVGAISSLYLGSVSLDIVGAFVGLVVGFVDGLVGGFVFAWLYNWFEKKGW